jgi:hypothetical protein
MRAFASAFQSLLVGTTGFQGRPGFIMQCMTYSSAHAKMSYLQTPISPVLHDRKAQKNASAISSAEAPKSILRCCSLDQA